ncbi:TetR/AcrR family transcriptional regulator [Nocardia sp. NPDC003693]
MSSPPVVWRGSTMASRSAERREQLIDAAYDLLATEGAAATTMRAVCRKASLSLRYFYESFSDRDELVIEVHDRITNDLLDAVTTALSGPDTDHPRAWIAFDAATRFLEQDPRRGHILFRETLADEALRDHGATAVPAFVALVAAQLDEPGAAMTGPNMHLAVSSLSGALVALFMDWLDGTTEHTREDIVDYTTVLATTILQL